MHIRLASTAGRCRNVGVFACMGPANAVSRTCTMMASESSHLVIGSATHPSVKQVVVNRIWHAEDRKRQLLSSAHWIFGGFRLTQNFVPLPLMNWIRCTNYMIGLMIRITRLQLRTRRSNWFAERKQARKRVSWRHSGSLPCDKQEVWQQHPSCHATCTGRAFAGFIFTSKLVRGNIIVIIVRRQ
jgi:hypothetical protein